MILDRVKERTETDLSDTELQLMIDEINQEIINRFGPHPDPANPITVWKEGNRELIVLDKPMDTTQPITITEFYDWWGIGGESSFTLDASDYRIWEPWHTTIQRWWGGTAFFPRRLWGDRVQITYTPIDDGNQREEVIIKIVALGIEYDAFLDTKVGDYGTTKNNYQDEREKLLQSLAPRRGLYMA